MGNLNAKSYPTTKMGPHLINPEDVVDFPEFPPGTKSLLMKHLSHQIWEQLKDKKDKYGFTFRQAIFSGCKNTDSGVGCYAGSHDSYYAFAPFFDKIIEDYHKHGPSDKHVSDMDASKLKCPPFSAEDAAMIASTRVRVGRNLADYPLGPALTREQRLEVMNKVVSALKTFEGDLKGTFYPLKGMDKETQNKLIADHFLFKYGVVSIRTQMATQDGGPWTATFSLLLLIREGDRFLEACGLNRDWPEGRGIFHNKEKTFLVWVNEEDQLRIISMQQGADLHQVFDRLSRACAHIEKVAKFSHDDHLGYITSCPTNLGTALRASVHIKLPKLAKKMPEFQAIADKYYVQIRGIHGEHSESDDGTYDISNKRRLGRSERELVQDMYDGVKAMIQKEKSLH